MQTNIADLESGQSGLTADPDQVQGGLPILSSVWIIENVAKNGDSTTLPPATPGSIVTIKNDAAKDIAVFPSPGDSINREDANVSITLPAGEAIKVASGDNERWVTK